LPAARRDASSASRAATLGSLDYGTPIYFRRIQVGQVASYSLDQDGRELTVRIFVNAPYDRFVKPETRFWQASGLDFSLSANGLNVQTESLAVAADRWDRLRHAGSGRTGRGRGGGDQFRPVCRPGRGHEGARTRGDALCSPLRRIGPRAVGRCARDLARLPIGEVVSVRLEAGDRKQLQVRARVLVAAYPQRFLDVLADPQELTGGKALTPALRKSIIEQLVARGLRAQLRTGNLLTGQLYVALDYATNPAKREDRLAAPSRRSSR
jgi:paraquat-inducible protein B